MKPYIILALLVAVAFGNSLPNQFVWDDFGLIVYNQRIDLPLSEIPSLIGMSFWKSTGIEEAGQAYYYRPLLYTYLVLNYKLWGPNPMGFHIAGILLHFLSAVLLYRTGLLLLNNDRMVSLMAASLFAVHPVHNESVGRAVAGEPLLGLVFLLTIYFFLKDKVPLSLFFFSLALLTKETAVMLPFALLIIGVHRKDLKNGALAMTPFVLLVIVYLLLRTMSVASVFGDRPAQAFHVRLFTMAVATLDYIRLILFPYPFSAFYPGRWYSSVLEPMVLLAVAVIISVGYIMYRSRGDKVRLFLLAGPFIMLAPVIWRVNTFRAGQDFVYIAERFLYLPVMFFALIISVAAAKLAGDRRQLLGFGWVALCVVLTAVTFSANKIWENSFVFFKRITEESPNTGFAHYNLGVVYHNLGQYEKAVGEFLRVLELYPGHIDARYTLGMSYDEIGDLDNAAEEYRKTIKLRPGHAEAHGRLGFVHYRKGQFDEAVEAYENATRINPNHAGSHNNLGLAYYKQGRLDEAVREYGVAVRLNPGGVNAHYNLGLAYSKKGSADLARAEFQTVLKLNPAHPHARKNLDALAGESGR